MAPRSLLCLLVLLLSLSMTLSLAAGQVNSTSTATTTAACVTKCTTSKTKCRKPHEAKLTACTSLHGCDKTYCPGNYACRFGCAVCKSYWNHYIGECDRSVAACTARCTTTTTA